MVQKTFFRILGDSTQPGSLAMRMRRRRFRLFRLLLETLPDPLHLLDAGGTQKFWSSMGMPGQNELHIVLLNLTEEQTTSPNFTSVAGNVTNMVQFQDKAFDVVFSNSVIEHVGGFADQLKMANEIRRVGKRYFLQTPNRYFPLEPHFFFPLFQFFPLWLKVWLVTSFALGNYAKIEDRSKAIEVVNAIRLLTRRELKILFPNATLFEEKFLGLTKSFIVYQGWELL